MHQRLGTGTEIHDARDGAVRVHEPQLLALDQLVVGAEIGVPVHVGREGRGRVDDVKGHCVPYEGRPGRGPVRFDDGLARGVVSGDVVREAGEAGGELGFVAGAGVLGHGAGF